MNNWVKISSEELKVQMRIAGLKKGELQIKYAKDVCELEERIDKAIEYIEEHKRNVYDTFGEGIVFGEIDGIKEILSILKGDSNE